MIGTRFEVLFAGVAGAYKLVFVTMVGGDGCVAGLDVVWVCAELRSLRALGLRIGSACVVVVGALIGAAFKFAVLIAPLPEVILAFELVVVVVGTLIGAAFELVALIAPLPDVMPAFKFVALIRPLPERVPSFELVVLTTPMGAAFEAAVLATPTGTAFEVGVSIAFKFVKRNSCCA